MSNVRLSIIMRKSFSFIRMEKMYRCFFCMHKSNNQIWIKNIYVDRVGLIHKENVWINAHVTSVAYWISLGSFKPFSKVTSKSLNFIQLHATKETFRKFFFFYANIFAHTRCGSKWCAHKCECVFFLQWNVYWGNKFWFNNNDTLRDRQPTGS